MLYYTILNYIMLYYIILYLKILYFIILNYIIFVYIILYYIIYIDSIYPWFWDSYADLEGLGGALMGKLMVKHQAMGFSWGLLGKKKTEFTLWYFDIAMEAISMFKSPFY